LDLLWRTVLQTVFSGRAGSQKEKNWCWPHLFYQFYHHHLNSIHFNAWTVGIQHQEYIHEAKHYCKNPVIQWFCKLEKKKAQNIIKRNGTTCLRKKSRGRPYPCHSLI
jgi:hypothetical protein